MGCGTVNGAPAASNKSCGSVWIHALEPETYQKPRDKTHQTAAQCTGRHADQNARAICTGLGIVQQCLHWPSRSFVLVII